MANKNDDIISALKNGGNKKKPTPKGEEILNKPDNSLVPHELDDDYHKQVNGKGEHWGYHLLIDMSECNKKIDDEKAVEEFLKTLVDEIDMRPIGPPTVIRVDSASEGRGVTGVQIIETSTITFHGDDDKWSAYIDIFSCKTFDPKVALKHIEKYFQPKKMGTFFLFRDAGRWPSK